MKNEHMYLSLLVKLSAIQRLGFQSELCNLRDSIAEEYGISSETIHNDFEHMVTCIRHNLPLYEMIYCYPVIRSWCIAYGVKNGI